MSVSILVAYLVGSIPFALILARVWGPHDLRRVGSGNPGAANVWRAYGVRPGIIVALLDVAKGAGSVLLAERLSSVGAAGAAAGVAAVVGHVFPIWVRFRGGKGVATAFGAFSVLAPLAAGPVVGVFILGVWITKYISMGSVLASATLPPMAYAAGSAPPVVVAAVVTATLVIVRHRTNLARVRAGTERRLGLREHWQGGQG